ncbi:hypothetical protein [Weissella viridescens]|uniref:hypothetical protein n=1 Tax=Weissella viridescens TaxID=1629 RepID=UPI003AA7CC55
MLKKKSKLLSYIDECAQLPETQRETELVELFNHYEQQKDKNLDKALVDLKSELNNFQINHNYTGPKYIAELETMIAQTANLKEGTGTMALLFKAWF